MNGLMIKKEIKIEDMIYEIRGKQVMLDSDLAKLYHVETKRINEAVKNNPIKFPERFCFELNKEEANELLRSKISTLNKNNNKRGQHIKYLPNVFTEQGVYMLATILKTEVAAKITVKIMDTFVAMRHYIGNNMLEQKYYNDMTVRHDSEIKLLQQAFDSFKNKDEIYFDGKIYDAYSKIKDIFSEAKKELIIVDRYTDKTILDIIKNLRCKAILITGTNTKLTKLDISKYNETYDNLTIYYNDSFHDRYFVIDNNKIYHSGNSINHIGLRKSSINLLSDDGVRNKILDDINSIIKEI